MLNSYYIENLIELQGFQIKNGEDGQRCENYRKKNQYAEIACYLRRRPKISPQAIFEPEFPDG